MKEITLDPNEFSTFMSKSLLIIGSRLMRSILPSLFVLALIPLWITAQISEEKAHRVEGEFKFQNSIVPKFFQQGSTAALLCANTVRQFRLYVRLIPGAAAKLASSREFSRGKDNAAFHHGYPINYRQKGSAPTLQFSITAEMDRADIDVDYRSSGFPKALFNGHLTAGNSDVRVGGLPKIILSACSLGN